MIRKMIVGISLSLFMVIFGFMDCRGKDIDLPVKLGNLNLSKVITEDEAHDIVNKMHGKTLGALENIIAHYGQGERNILYISIFKDAQTAKSDLMNMAMKMARGTAVFTPLSFDTMGERVHFRTEGMGLVHYFYRDDTILIWWQVEPENEKSTSKDLFDFDFSSLKEKHGED